MKILHVEPDQSVADVFHRILQAEGGFVHEQAETAEDAFHLAKVYAYDLIVTENRLPDGSGINLIRLLRGAKVKTPVIVLAGLAELHDKVLAFKYGADDFIEKPFHRDELMARIFAVARRAQGHPDNILRRGRLEVDLDQKLVRLDGKLVHLTGKEYHVVELLALRRGVCLTKEALLSGLYLDRDEPEIKIIDVFVCKARKKFNDVCGYSPIETVWGRGYRLAEGNAHAPVAA